MTIQYISLCYLHSFEMEPRPRRLEFHNFVWGLHFQITMQPFLVFPDIQDSSCNSSIHVTMIYPRPVAHSWFMGVKTLVKIVILNTNKQKIVY